MRRLTLILVLVLAGTANAARVDVAVRALEPGGIRDDIGAIVTVTYRAAPGERNDVRVRAANRSGTRIVFTDRVPIRPGKRCRRRPPGVVCRVGAENRFALVRTHVRLGDRDDRARLRLGASAAGGPGDDMIVGSGSSDVVSGGPGADVLRGRGGADQLRDGPGVDRVMGGDDGDTFLSTDAGPDLLRGGRGYDILSYASRRSPVTAALGQVSDGDLDRGFEHLIGGRAGDVLVGTPGADRIEGGPGPDRIIARGGPDLLSGDGGFNVIDAGPGDDVVNYGERDGLDDVTCGAGVDTVDSAAADRLLRPDCERLVLPEGFAQPVAVDADGVTLRIVCTSVAGEASRLIRLATPPAARPWATAGPFNALVAEGVAPVSSAEYCDVRLRFTEGSRALPRPLVVVATSKATGSWSFILP